MSSKAVKYAKDFVSFVNASPTPYHVVDNVKKQLLDVGFKELSEKKIWAGQVKKGGKYFVTRNGSSIIAFTVGGSWTPGNGISIIGAHTDSPTLRIKPISTSTKEGFQQIGVETYGGGIWHTWFDRDLSVAGRVFVYDEATGKFYSRLVNINKPILRIPTLAIHLTKERYVKFEFNKETQFRPIAGLEGDKKTSGCCDSEPLSETEFNSIQNIVSRHNKELLSLIAADLGVETTHIQDFELVLYDHQPSTLGGLNEEFIFSPRLDNQVSCFCATRGLINSVGDIDTQSGIQLISLFDHEEIGSLSAQGADSSFLPDILSRITRLTGNETSADQLQSESYFLQSMAKSFLISSDMAHGVHPNYSEAYDSLNKPSINKGPVLKVNSNQRYVTNSVGIVLLKKLGELAKVPLQLFVVRNDSPCGSTIGPMLSAKLGIKTLDLGNPQLSMHSIRETGGTYDVEKLVTLFETYFEHYADLESKILVDAIDEE